MYSVIQCIMIIQNKIHCCCKTKIQLIHQWWRYRKGRGCSSSPPHFKEGWSGWDRWFKNEITVNDNLLLNLTVEVVWPRSEYRKTCDCHVGVHLIEIAIAIIIVTINTYECLIKTRGPTTLWLFMICSFLWLSESASLWSTDLCVPVFSLLISVCQLIFDPFDPPQRGKLTRAEQQRGKPPTTTWSHTMVHRRTY